MPAVTVVIPAYNAARTLPDTLAALRAQQPVPGGHEVIVVDDGSGDATAEVARSGGATVIRGEARGPGAARNLGAAHAVAPVLAFTDADCMPTPDWLAAGLRAMERADFVQGSVGPPPGVPYGPFDRTLWVVAEVGLYESANVLVRRDLFERLGGFESWLGPRRGIELGEDVLLGWRARRAGARVRFCPEVRVHHAVHPRGPCGYVAERWRLRFFPPMVRRIPELRRTLCYRSLFLTRRSAAFDLALAGVAGAAVARRPAALVAAVPYAVLAGRGALRHGRAAAPGAGLVDLAADAIGATALALGSARAGTLLL